MKKEFIAEVHELDVSFPGHPKTIWNLSLVRLEDGHYAGSAHLHSGDRDECEVRARQLVEIGAAKRIDVADLVLRATRAEAARRESLALVERTIASLESYIAQPANPDRLPFLRESLEKALARRADLQARSSLDEEAFIGAAA